MILKNLAWTLRLMGLDVLGGIGFSFSLRSPGGHERDPMMEDRKNQRAVVFHTNPAHSLGRKLESGFNEVERLLKVMAKVNPSVQRFVRIPKNENGDLDPQSLAAAIDHGFRVVRWHLSC